MNTVVILHTHLLLFICWPDCRWNIGCSAVILYTDLLLLLFCHPDYCCGIGCSVVMLHADLLLFCLDCCWSWLCRAVILHTDLLLFCCSDCCMHDVVLTSQEGITSGHWLSMKQRLPDLILFWGPFPSHLSPFLVSDEDVRSWSVTTLTILGGWSTK